MKLNINVKEETIKVGDLVCNKSTKKIYLLIWDERSINYPFRLLDVASGNVKNGYTNLSTIQEDYSLVAKSKDLELTVNARR